jgi:ribosome recycling factor
MIEAIKKDCDVRMHKSIDALKSELTKIRTGRAHVSILDHVTVDYFGSMVPLSQVAKL